MCDNRFVFDMELIWARIMEKAKSLAKKGGEEDIAFLDYLNSFPGTPKLEDFTFFRKYLPQFILPDELREMKLLNDCEMSKESADLLLKLTAASFSSTYELAYRGGLQLLITAASREVTVRKSIQELSEPQVAELFPIYIGEQLHLDFLVYSDPSLDEVFDMNREDCLYYFNEQVAKVIRTMHADEALKRLDDQLDDLLKS